MLRLCSAQRRTPHRLFTQRLQVGCLRAGHRVVPADPFVGVLLEIEGLASVMSVSPPRRHLVTCSAMSSPAQLDMRQLSPPLKPCRSQLQRWSASAAARSQLATRKARGVQLWLFRSSHLIAATTCQSVLHERGSSGAREREKRLCACVFAFALCTPACDPSEFDPVERAARPDAGTHAQRSDQTGADASSANQASEPEGGRAGDEPTPAGDAGGRGGVGGDAMRGGSSGQSGAI